MRIVNFLLVLMAAFGTWQVAICTSLYGNVTDRLSLIAFKEEAISLDPTKALVSWNDSTHFCNWEGLIGQISPSLGNLTFLRRLVLSKNAFTGEISLSITRLRRLQILILTNTLRGMIPNFANSSSLKNLQLANNVLVGQFPDLPYHLQHLELEYNGLAGTIPASLANITTLTTFSCEGNNIKGNIPDELGKLPGMKFLAAGENQLAGRFPRAVMNLSALTVLSLPVNRLSGVTPNNLGTSQPNLQTLLGNNFFGGYIPHSLTNASNLHLLDMSNNNFTGVVPSSIGQLTTLSFRNLEKNQLQARNRQGWEFMNSSANCTRLHHISLASNHLEGPVPKSLGSLSNQLQVLYLGKNKLSGGFPSGIENLPNLVALALHDNQFTGELPEWLGTLKGLQIMGLSRNNFTGFIPSSLSNLSRLVSLFLDSNKFGMLTKEIFGILTIIQTDLSSNNLDGQLPKEVGNAKQFVNIPNTLGNCESLQYVKLDRNIFSGTIPTSLGKLSTLQVLNLSRNNLTGPIPVPLGSLHLLEKLDLSFNHLKGEVPRQGIFRNVTALRIDGNQELCGGALELHLLAWKLFQDRTVVAVQVFSLETGGAQKSFITECNSLRNLRHLNLVPILTACSSSDSEGNDFKALLYSAQNNANTSTSNRTTLAQRLCIVVDVAGALEYLHHRSQGTIVHCDLKPRNILLDNNMTAHIGDFGLARFKVDSAASSFADSISASSIGIKGTIGYVAPEEEHDVSEETSSLECLLSVLKVGLSCANPSPNERMDMQRVAAGLHGIKEAYLRGTEVTLRS
uniref:Protein kinase domain-containing protein n=1 Tax=Setaria italica TaxID=4555 RepID=K3ZMY8_SETIT